MCAPLVCAATCCCGPAPAASAGTAPCVRALGVWPGGGEASFVEFVANDAWYCSGLERGAGTEAVPPHASLCFGLAIGAGKLAAGLTSARSRGLAIGAGSGAGWAHSEPCCCSRLDFGRQAPSAGAEVVAAALHGAPPC